MNLTEAITRLNQFFQESAGVCARSPEEMAELRAAWELVKPELPDRDRITSSWDVGDVGTALEDNFNVPADTLTDDEKRQVLKDVEDGVNAGNEISWSTINASIESLFSDVVEEAQDRQEGGGQ